MAGRAGRAEAACARVGHTVTRVIAARHIRRQQYRASTLAHTRTRTHTHTHAQTRRVGTCSAARTTSGERERMCVCVTPLLMCLGRGRYAAPTHLTHTHTHTHLITCGACVRSFAAGNAWLTVVGKLERHSVIFLT